METSPLTIPAVRIKRLQDHDIVLIKWQYEDSETGRIRQLQKLLPHAKHRIILLELPIATLKQRLTARPWWSSITDQDAFIRDEYMNIDRFLQATALPVTRVDCSSATNYRLIKS